MAENISNQNGRALEYKIIEYLISDNSQFSITLTERAAQDQVRDKSNYEGLSSDLKESYAKCSAIVHDWLIDRVKKKDVEIDRLPDSAAKEGDVTDIRIQTGAQPINLSIKHNHSALKHQRPPTTAQRCGYEKGSEQDVHFRKQYEEVIQEFLSKAEELKSDAKNFRDLVAVEEDFISVNLYLPICNLVAATINDLCLDKKNVQALFDFLVGSTEFYKITDYSDHVAVADFSAIGSVESVSANVEGNSYVYLNFSNGWTISMRIHTAASALGKSVKFDTQPISLPDVPSITIPKD